MLNAVPAGSGRPGALGSGLDRELQQTRIAAAFDSRPEAERASSSALWWLVGGVSLFAVLAIVGGVLMVRALRGPVAREPAVYEPDVTSLGAASRPTKVTETTDLADPAHTVVPAVPTAFVVGPAIKVRPPEQKTPDPAERF